MTWTLKILADNFSQRSVVLLNETGTLEKQSGITKDFVLNHYRNHSSTWREVGYTLNKRAGFINKQNVDNLFIMDSISNPYQFLTPLQEKVIVVLPLKPKEHTKYLIKNLSNTRSIVIKTEEGGPELIVLRNPDNIVKLYFDSVQYQLEI